MPQYDDGDAEGMIVPGSCGLLPADDWQDGTYIWGKNGWVWISMVIATKPGSGAFSRLLRRIESSGRGVVVPNPFPQMHAICLAKGFRADFDKETGCDLMVLDQRDKHP